ncbi:MAG TPA: protein kinase [Vicinamibacterales bacterium]|nr:protein kinase [Vicinamibacterales bacterium]
MSLELGSRVGPYQVVSLLGAGGMGEVYCARDTKLNREVALKVVPEAFTSDMSRLARFEREAQLLASLSHPNIAAIYGLEATALVLELVDGPTLADRLGHGPFPLDEVLPIARQITQALEAAHEQGIVHRDLKPANIKVRADGTVKVLDFGLAKLVEVDRSTRSSDQIGASQSPTMTSPAMTQAGVILGTAAYMAPEQARGRPADKRSDMWSFGCVLFEMLTGRRAFPGEDVAETLAAVIKGQPDWATLPADTPAAIRRLLRRCLTKEPRERLGDASTARFELDDVASGLAVSESPISPTREPRRWWTWIAVAGIALAIGAVMGRSLMSPRVAESPELRLEITTPPASYPTSIAISPDGRSLVFEATQGGQSQLWLRPLDSDEMRPLMNTKDGQYPFWSPDSRSVGFFAEGRLKTLDIGSGSVQSLANANAGIGAAWSDDGFIYFVANPNRPMLKIRDDGGEPVALSATDTVIGFPRLIPGNRLLFYNLGGGLPRGLYAVGTDGSDVRKLVDADFGGPYLSSGHLLFIRQGTLFAQGFDPATLSLKERPIPIADQVVSDGRQVAALSASTDGVIAFRKGTGGRQSSRRLAWFDRSGKERETIGEPLVAGNASLSPDGRVVALQRSLGDNIDIWTLDIARGTLARFTTHPAIDVNPHWSPDGRRIVWSSSRDGAIDFYQKSFENPSAPDERLVTSGPRQARTLMDWSADGQFLLYRVTSQTGGYDLWALATKEPDKPFPIEQQRFDEREGQFSPNGQWIAYQSDDTGRFEIYLRPFRGTGARTQISRNGGGQARWRADGKELFFVGLDGRLMAVAIEWLSDGSPRAADPVALFAANIGAPIPVIDRQQYIVSRDGQRFLMHTFVEADAAPITVIVNWKPKVETIP